MTQYYERDANRIESLANLISNPATQAELWALAARVGTVVEWHDCGLCQKPSPGYTGPCGCYD